MQTSSPERRAVDARSIAEAFRITAAQRADQVALRLKDDEVTWTWGELRDRVDGLAGGLQALEVAKGDTVALLIGNRPEFHQADLAAMMLGATPFSIYMQYTPEQIRYVVADAGAKVMLCEQQFLAGVLEARRELPDLATVVVIDGEAPEGVLRLDDVMRAPGDFDGDAAAAELGPEDALTLIYTSGTTGPPKGVELVHRNLLAATASAKAQIDFPDGARVISWLPSAHIAERAAHHYIPIVFGMQVTCCPNPREVLAYVQAVRPQWFFAVPRVWEKLKSGLETMVASQPEEQRAASEAALDAARRKVRLEQSGQAVPDELASAVARADAELFAPLRSMLGFDEVVAVNAGAAPTPVGVLEFFHAIGIPVAELWGMSETCGAGSCNPLGAVRLGTVGLPAPGVEITLAKDGEVLVRSDVVMRGYRNLPERTAEAIDPDGWLHTGDVGAFDDAGYLRIVDRKKEIIINAAGKNMSPANIEATVKTSSPIIGQACVIGDGRPYNTALIVLDADFAPLWATQHGLTDTDLAALAGQDAIRAAVQDGVDAANAELARVEQLKRFTIVAGDWLPGGDELTPTMKLKRRPIGEKYAEAIEAMYPG